MITLTDNTYDIIRINYTHTPYMCYHKTQLHTRTMHPVVVSCTHLWHFHVISESDDGICKFVLPVFLFLLIIRDVKLYNQITSTRQRCPNVVFIDSN
jgi:hypothetical protein